MPDLITYQLSGGYTVRTINHSHPDNTPIPSGLDPDNPGDIQAASWAVYILQQTPSFNIFLPGTGEYIPFRPNSTPEDYETKSSIQLDEFIVTKKKIF